eukprot:8911960-Lingulodinium_polyedra.AAC.1
MRAAWSESPGCHLLPTVHRATSSVETAKMSKDRLPCGPRCAHPWNGTAVTPNPVNHCSSRAAKVASSEPLGRSKSTRTPPATI